MLQFALARGIGEVSIKKAIAFIESNNLSWDDFIQDRNLLYHFGLKDNVITNISTTKSQAYALYEELELSGVKILSESDIAYPQYLKKMLQDKCPSILFVSGNIDLLNSIAVGFCGSRKASAKGIGIAADCSRQLTKENITVISGYLVNPIISLTVDLDKSISFNKYLIQETTTRELKKQRDRIRQQILANKSRFAIYSVSEKEQAVTLIKEYLSYYDCDFDGGSLSEIRRELRKVREEIRILQNGNDTEKINSLSADITQLYKSSIEVSELAEYDFRKSGFHISYLKNGNILQPQILDEESDSADQIKNYYTGSMARHTLMQLCGYLGFLRMLIKEDKYPLIPFLVIDHISKPFDDKNQKALGAILHGAYTNLQKSEMQIILFDDEDASSLGLTPDHSINLLGEDKSGFNPFYMPSKEDSPNAPEEVE